MKKERIIITGGSGFIARNLIEYFSNKKNFSVIVLDKTKLPKKNQIQGIKYLKINILNKNNLIKAIHPNSIVYHFAAIADIDDANKNHLDAINVNINGTVNLLEACKKKKVKKIIFASSIYALSEQGGFYSTTKLSSEMLISRYSQKFDLKFTILRFGSLYGRYSDKNNTISNFIHQAIKHRKIIRFSDGKEIRNYINVIDAIKLCYEFRKKKYNNKYYNLVGKKKYTVKEVIKIISKITPLKKIIFKPKLIDKYHYKKNPYTYTLKFGKFLYSNSEITLEQGLKSLIKKK